MVSNKLTQKSTQKQRQQDNDDDGYTSQTQRRSQIIATDEDTETRLQVRLDYRKFIDELNTNRQLYTSPDNDALERKIDQVDEAFAKVKMPREGVLDASTLRTISNLASIRIRAVDEAGSLDRAYDFARKCEKILSKLVGNANEFYEIFGNFHHIVPSSSMMNGRLPTKLFTNEYLEKQKQRAKPVRQQKLTQEELEKSRTRPEEVKEFNSELGEQTIKQIMHIKRCLVERYKATDSSPADYFEFVIDPKSFAKTVENMFHVSFLIKEGFVNLFQDEVNLPALEPTDKALNRTPMSASQTENSPERANQMIMSITMDEWEQLIEVYGITEAQIPHKNN
ncbi:unnamed protein product [Rotaria magnacalcarata]|uniref:Non-structural maintenance of chromosomes element 4 n=4 Tax=Rotaria magnacalcarata TaxID=392030 RepID=A0A816YHK8_9BILA|nr:unnamed protein product [Rotaria magnacalcarata]CAF1496255.1 unnamed protein product [Rotaria magnacalcarata]CAF1929335.1 unnamed protein product [Rotaria magnacalcarata]CAF2161405.1 unnamed protein product [Rotaria magnacalcarata]CAF2176124.1 unnamed protein product [Rotaria magnacalcarata]